MIVDFSSEHARGLSCQSIMLRLVAVASLLVIASAMNQSER